MASIRDLGDPLNNVKRPDFVGGEVVKQYRNFDVPPGHSPTHQLPSVAHNPIPQGSQVPRIIPETLNISRVGINPLIERGSVELSGIPTSHPVSLGIAPSVLPKPHSDSIQMSLLRPKTATGPSPNPTVIGRYNKKKNRHSKKKQGFYGI